MATNMLKNMCYHAKFVRSALKGVAINTGRCNSALLGWEAWLTPRYTPLLRVLPRLI